MIYGKKEAKLKVEIGKIYSCKTPGVKGAFDVRVLEKLKYNGYSVEVTSCTREQEPFFKKQGYKLIARGTLLREKEQIEKEQRIEREKRIRQERRQAKKEQELKEKEKRRQEREKTKEERLRRKNEERLRLKYAGIEERNIDLQGIYFCEMPNLRRPIEVQIISVKGYREYLVRVVRWTKEQRDQLKEEYGTRFVVEEEQILEKSTNFLLGGLLN